MQDTLIPAGEEFEIEFSVNGTDIRQGEVEDCWSCPIARCVSRMLPGYAAEVDQNEITIYEIDVFGKIEIGRPVAKARTPYPAQCFIEDFDSDEPVAPFTFKAAFTRVLQVPRPALAWKVVHHP